MSGSWENVQKLSEIGTFWKFPKDLVGRKIFLGESKITSFIFIICVYLAGFKMNGFHRKWHNLVIMCPSDLGQGSKFSLIQYLKLFS